jgi:hypothetical protein
MAALVTRDTIADMLRDERPAYVAMVIGRALVVIFNNQTKGEQSANVTDNNNGIGFTGADARTGSLTAKYYLRHKTLLQWQVDKWTKLDSKGYPRLAKYHKQLDAAARAKAQPQL